MSAVWRNLGVASAKGPTGADAKEEGFDVSWREGGCWMSPGWCLNPCSFVKPWDYGAAPATSLQMQG